METISFRIVGITPLMMHNGRLANPLDHFAKQIKEITGKRKKTEDDHRAVARLEFEGGLYYDPKIGPYIPGANMDACLVDGARLHKRGKDIERCVQTVEDKIPLEYKGPHTDLDEMFKLFADMRTVVIGGKSIMRCRPAFPEWAAHFSLLYNPEMMNPADLQLCLESAGKYVGLMDGQRCGRFVATVNGKAK